MQKTSENGLHFVQFDLLLNCKELVHASFSRRGGVSIGPYGNLNTSYTVGDHPNAVAANQELICKVLGLGRLQQVNQCHGTAIQVVKDNATPQDADALITKRQGVGLTINHADCQAALMYDPINKVIANVHAGWRGSAAAIYTKTIAELKSLFGCRPENLLVCISPSLGPEKSEFVHYKTELPKAFWPFQVRPYYFDLWTISEAELLAAGILPGHIEIARQCTYSNAEDYFSYRRDKQTGRMATVIGLKHS